MQYLQNGETESFVEDTSEIEEVLPDLATILQVPDTDERLQRAGEAKELDRDRDAATGKETKRKAVQREISTAETKSKSSSKMPLKLLEYDSPQSMIKTCAKGSTQVLNKPAQDEPYSRKSRTRFTPKRVTTKPVDYSIYSAGKEERRVSFSEEDESFTDLSGFIVPDFESDDEYQKMEVNRKGSRRPFKKTPYDTKTPENDEVAQELLKAINGRISSSIPLKLFSSNEPLAISTNALPNEWPLLFTESMKLEEDLLCLKSTAPRLKNSSVRKDLNRPITPPFSPPKPNLSSPSMKHRIPPSPHRPSIDGFWSQDVINHWNDQHSPKKPPRTPGRKRLLTLDENDESYVSPCSSPRKSLAKSPTKKERQALRIFETEKVELAINFLKELDEKITSLRLADLTAATGGVKIIWSKKLSSTAGRANWRREAVRRKNPDGTFSETTYRHHASVELAEKVIDCEERLINVLAHEYCHLANFMISGVKDQPHGKEFKIWASKVTHAFEDRGIKVTTKHGYDINYRYIWTCDSCDLEYKRHSKSIDPDKHSCGVCKGKLVQVLPVPRRENDYQRFVKTNWDRAKKTVGEGAGMGKINGLLAKEWEVKKLEAERAKQLVVAVAEVAGGPRDESYNVPENLESDDVALKLDSLTLEA